MKTPLQFLMTQKIKLIIAALLIFILSFVSQIILYHSHKTAIIAEESKTFQLALLEELSMKNSTLEALSYLLGNVEDHTANTTLNAVASNKYSLGLVAVGKAYQLPHSEIFKLEHTMLAKGYESFKVKPFVSSQQPLGETSTIILKAAPFTPQIQTFLGQDLSTLKLFDARQKQMLETLLPQPIFFLDENAPYLLLFFAKKTPYQEQPLSSYYFFHIIDIMEITNFLAHKIFSTPPTNLSLQTEDHKHIPLLTHKTVESIFGIKQELTTGINGVPITISLYFSFLWTDINLIHIISWSILLSIMLFLLFLSFLILKKYLVELKLEQSRQQELLRNSHEAIIITTEQGKITHWNPRAVILFGYQYNDVKEQYIQKLIFSTVNNKTNLSLADFQKLDFTNSWVTQFLTRSKTLIECKVSTSKLKLSKGDEIAFYIEDISKQKLHENEIRQLAYYDTLTGLENRTYFSLNVEEILSKNPTTNSALLFIDLDGFKRVNDSLGHTVGDQLLKLIAQRLTNSTRSKERNTHLCRFGGDEFIFYLHDISFEDTVKTTLRILKQIEKIIHIGENDIQISASIGIALTPKHALDLDSLLRFADTAMYKAKAKGKNTYATYNLNMEEQLSQILTIEKHLRTAITNNEFNLLYQPQINTKTNQVSGVEALLRWNNPTLGFVPPDQFIHIAEDCGQIIKIGDWVAQQAIAQLKTWQETPHKNIRIAINVSAQQIEQEEFSSKISQWLADAKIDSKLLEIELTERSIMSNADTNIEIFKDFRTKGLSLAIDDFGTGYSSLSYLKRFPINILKVDKSFIDGLPFDEDDASICTAIIQMAHNLNMLVVAEGVETAEQLHFLQSLNCDLIQGYYFSKPLPVKDLEIWVLERETEPAIP